VNCPTDGETLMMSERKGVEIDYCPRCRGIWLDRGELDKLIAAAEGDDDRWERGDRSDRDDRWDRDDRSDRDDRRQRGERDWEDRPVVGYGDHRRKRKKSFLSEMFEFGD
jgi:uncharacterized protein